MYNFMQIAQGVNVQPLLLELQRQPHLWNKNPCRLSKKGPHWQTDDIFIRYKDERPAFKDPKLWAKFGDKHIPKWYKSYDLLPACRPLIFNLMAMVGAEMLGGVFIYRVAPGKQILPHKDPGWHATYYDKFNICILSNDEARFEYPDQGEAMVQCPGDIHHFRNDTTHQVINEGQCDHIIMTVCVRLDRGERVPWSPEGWTLDNQFGGE